jgi:hypothetical protein
MLKTSFIAVLFFVIGFFSAIIYKDKVQFADNNSGYVKTTSDNNEQVTTQKENTSSNQVNQQAPKEISDLIKLSEPRTPFAYYQILTSLEQYSADEVEAYLLSIDPNKTDLRNQIIWFFSGKFPEKAIDLLSTEAGSDSELTKILGYHLTFNHPDLVWNWINDNPDGINSLYKTETERFQFKLTALNALSRLPDSKWAAYEQGLKIISEGPRPQDKYSLLTLAQNVASSNPLEAIHYAASDKNNPNNRHLLNGAITEYARQDPAYASRLILENEDRIDSMAVTATTTQLLFKDQYDEAFSLADSLKDESLKSSTIDQLASNLVTYGRNDEYGLKLINTFKDDASKIKAASSLINSMSVLGYPVEKRLEILEQGLPEVPAISKSWSYAWTLKQGYGKDADATRNYVNQLRYKDPELAKGVDEILKNLD